MKLSYIHYNLDCVFILANMAVETVKRSICNLLIALTFRRSVDLSTRKKNRLFKLTSNDML